MPKRVPPTSFTAGRKMVLGGVTYNPGDTIPNATVKALRRLNRLLSRRYIIPNTEVYPIRKSGAARLLARPRPTSLNPRERANL
jgi:hypothetical protein